MKKLLLIVTILVVNFQAYSQTPTIQEKLGYPKDAKLVIIHADDLGVSHSENVASIEALENGVVSSASIMVPCPWFPEIAQYAVENPKADLGLHLTLNCEWEAYKWKPVASVSEVPTLVDSTGYFFNTTEKVVNSASVDEADIELRNQINKALAFGIDVTHLDAHMGTAFSTPGLTKMYMQLGRDYAVPVFLPRQLLAVMFGEDYRDLLQEGDIIVDHVVSAAPKDFEEGMAEFYRNALKSIQPGLTYLIIHTAYENEEMKAVTKGHPYWAADWRQDDFDFFTSEEARKIIAEENIQLITWREIRDKIVRK